MYRLGELAEQLDCQLVGDPDRVISGLAELHTAGPSDISFISDRRLRAALPATRAGAVVLTADLVPLHAGDALVCADPYLVYAQLSQLLAPPQAVVTGVADSAVVSPQASVHETCTVADHAVIEAGAVLAAAVVVGPGAWLGPGVQIGAATVLEAGVKIYPGTRIGSGCHVKAGAVLGGEGFGFARSGSGWEAISHLGGLRIGDQVRIGSNTCIDRGSLGDTVIDEGVIIDNQVQIAHNCRVGKNTAIAGCTGLAGSTIVGANCTLAGGVGSVGHLRLCDDVHITCMSMITQSIDQPGSYSSGTALMETRRWLKSAIRLKQLPDLFKRLRTPPGTVDK